MHAVQRSMRKPSGVERTDSDRLSPWQASAQASDGVLLVLIVGGNCDIVRRDTSVVGGRARTTEAQSARRARTRTKMAYHIGQL